MSHAEDKLGQEINPGDTVWLVYGGAHHYVKVDSIENPPSPSPNVPHIKGKTTITHPAQETTKVEPLDQTSKDHPQSVGQPDASKGHPAGSHHNRKPILAKGRK